MPSQIKSRPKDEEQRGEEQFADGECNQRTQAEADDFLVDSQGKTSASCDYDLIIPLRNPSAKLQYRRE
jgi:hypothetical protein